MGTKANRNFGDDPDLSGVHGFNPGGGDFSVARQVDGHIPYETGSDGNALHTPSAGSPQWDDPIGPKIED